MNTEITPSSGNIFLDLGFSSALANLYQHEVEQMIFCRKFPDAKLLIDFRKTIKIKIEEIKANVDAYRKHVATMGDRRDWEGCDKAEEDLYSELIKLGYYKEFSHLIKAFINEQYGLIKGETHE